MTRIDSTLLAEWFDAHGARLVLYARQWLNAQSAEDIVQDVFIRLAAQPAAPDNPKAWLLVSVRNAALDTLKMSRRRKDRDHSAGETRARLFEGSSIRAGDGGDKLELADVQEALTQLSPMPREIITLRIWADVTFQEIAEITKLPLSTVYSHYRSGLDMLRARWESPCKT